GNPLFRTSMYQTFPSGPTAMSTWIARIVGRGSSVMTPVGVIRPIFPTPGTIVNHRFPSGPTVIAHGWARPGTDHSLIDPSGVIRPTLPPPAGRKTVYQTLPSGPATASWGNPPAVGSENSVNSGTYDAPVSSRTKSPGAAA